MDRVEIHDAAMVASRAWIGPGAVIGEGAWLGANVHVEPGIRIDDGAVVGAGAHVTSDVPAWTIALGRPATRHLPRRIVEMASRPSPKATIGAVSRRLDLYRVPWPDNSVVSCGALNDAHIVGGEGLRVRTRSVLMGRPTCGVDGGGIRIGAGVEIGNECVVEAFGGLEIDARTVIGDATTILTTGHDHTKLSLPRSETPVRIGVGVTVEAGATLVGPLVIGDGALIRSGNIVIRDVPPGGVSHSIV